jgi:hypothetical protein
MADTPESTPPATTSNSPNNIINDDLINDVLEKNVAVNTESNQALVTNETGSRFIQALSESTKGKLDFGKTLIAVSIICQKGGTSKNAQADIYANVDGHKVTLRDIRDVIRDKNFRFTLRQWARTYATQIHKIASRYSIIGDLAKIISRKHKTISQDDLYWLSNFQMDNDNCPIYLREYIIEHFNELFPGSKTR